MTPIIREAGLADAAEILDLWKMLHEENGIFPWNEKKAALAVKSCITNGAVFVAEVDNKIVGMLGVDREQPVYSESECLVDRFGFVHPDYRKSRIAVRLIRATLAFARELKMLVFFLLLTPKDTTRKAHLLARYMRPAGLVFVGGATP